ncbi:unnamed protein product, partial [Brachionus calyciflorus]
RFTLLYINDLPELLMSDSRLYADDNKIFRIHESCLSEKELHYEGNIINEPNYQIRRGDGSMFKLSNSFGEKDLGVMISKDLKWANHCESTVYQALVRPHLDYAVSVWNPYLKQYINLIENVQERATKMVKSLKHFSYEERLAKLDLSSLETRRIRGDLIQFFKIINGYENVKFKNGINYSISNYSNRRKKYKLTKENNKNCRARENFFTNRVVNNWNKLSNDVVEAINLNIFKAKLECNCKSLFG